MFASEIYDQNKIAAAEGRPVINLTSVLIGNGITDVSTYGPFFTPFTARISQLTLITRAH